MPMPSLRLCPFVAGLVVALVMPDVARTADSQSIPRYQPVDASEALVLPDIAGMPLRTSASVADSKRSGVQESGTRGILTARQASPGTRVGDTYHDFQHNGAAGRQIGVFGDTIMTAWTAGLSANATDRVIRWNRAIVAGAPVTVSLDDGSSIDVLPLDPPLYADGSAIPNLPSAPGFTTMDLVPGTSRSIVFSHTGGVHVRIDDPTNPGTFYGPGFQPSSPPAVDAPLWPKGAVGFDRSTSPEKTILHVLATTDPFVTFHTISYWRGELDQVSRNVVWKSAYSVGQSAAAEGYVVAADPHSDRVAIVFSQPLNLSWTGDEAHLNNLVYLESTDAGNSWSAPVFITSHPDKDPADPGYYATADLDALYDDGGNLHVVYAAQKWDGATFDRGDITLRHWDKASGSEHLILGAVWTNTCAFDQYGTGTWSELIAKPSISFKPFGAGPAQISSAEILYAVWTQFGPTADDCSDGPRGYTNGEIYYSASTDAGETWSIPVDVTGTHTPDCEANDCLSEQWVTAAERAGDGLYISYVEDTDPGGAPPSEGTWTRSPYKVLAIATAVPKLGGRMAVTPVDPPHWGDPYWSNVVLDIPEPATGDPVSAQFQVSNLGNTTLNYTAAVTTDAGGPSFVTVNGGSTYSGSIAPSSAAEVITVNIDPNGYGGLAQFRVQLAVDAPGFARSAGTAAEPDTVDLLFRVPGLPTCPITMTGDVNLSTTITSADIIGLVNYVFKSGADPLPCVAAGDINCGGTVTSADIIALVNYVFKSGASPCDGCTSPLAGEC